MTDLRAPVPEVVELRDLASRALRAHIAECEARNHFGRDDAAAVRDYITCWLDLNRAVPPQHKSAGHEIAGSRSPATFGKQS